MAAGISELLIGMQENLESEVKCPICLKRYNKPKMLPCGHVYCQDCLEGLASRSPKKISCPECRMDIPIPNKDVTNFPTSHQVNRLIDIQLKYEGRIKTCANKNLEEISKEKANFQNVRRVVCS